MKILRFAVLMLGLCTVMAAQDHAAHGMSKPATLMAGYGDLHHPISSKNPQAQEFFDQGLRQIYAFNHDEAARSFQRAGELDPKLAMAFWGVAEAVGPNYNDPASDDRFKQAHEAIQKALELSSSASASEVAYIQAMAIRFPADPQADRRKAAEAYYVAMRQLVKQYPDDLDAATLCAEAGMNLHPWGLWHPDGTPEVGTEEIVATLESVIRRDPSHMGAIHYYIHAVEASPFPERALAGANKLASLAPGAGHIVHMPAHTYYRVGMYREALDTNKRAMAVDEQYFGTSPSDPLYKVAYYPHNIHFLMVSAQMGGDGKAAIDAANRLDAAIPVEAVKQFAILQLVKAAPYTTRTQFSDADAILRLPAPPAGLVLVDAMYHYARAVAYARKGDGAAAQDELDALARIESGGDFKPLDEWSIPAKEIVQTARLVAAGRLADAKGDLAGAAKAYEDAVFIEDSLAYTEPPYWYYPVRQSLGSVLLRQGKLDDAEKAFRESLARVRNNGWALAGLAETYKRKGDAAGEKAAQRAFAKAWFGAPGGPPLAAL